MTVADPMILLRSVDADWNFARWEMLPDDGNRYEVIDGVLNMATCPSVFYQWIVGRLMKHVGMSIPGSIKRLFAPVAGQCATS
jgi:hypothetical protein